MPVRRLTPWAPESDLSYIGRFRAYQDRYFQPVPGADSPNSPTEVGNPGPDDGATINRSADVEMTGLEESSGEAEGAVPSVNVPAATQPDVEMAGLEESSGEAEGAGPSVNGPAATQPEVQAAGPEEGSGEAERAAPSASGPATTTPTAQASGERVSGEWPEQDLEHILTHRFARPPLSSERIGDTLPSGRRSGTACRLQLHRLRRGVESPEAFGQLPVRQQELVQRHRKAFQDYIVRFPSTKRDGETTGETKEKKETKETKGKVKKEEVKVKKEETKKGEGKGKGKAKEEEDEVKKEKKEKKEDEE
ncbi:hypothetical protein SMMN14_03170 [Sphaerulina musiva]